MKYDRLDDLLNLLRREELPTPPPNLEANVFRTIRLRQTEAEPAGSFVNELLGTIWRPGFVATVLALVVATSTATTVIAAELSDRAQPLPEAPAWAAEAIDIRILKHSDDVLACCRPSRSLEH